MRKMVLCIAVLSLALSAGHVMAAGAKPKKVSGSFGARLAPFPNQLLVLPQLGDASGCVGGEENVHWVGFPFTSPGKGTLRFYAEGFTGDHDLHVMADGVVVGSSEEQQVTLGTAAPPMEEILVPLKKNQEVILVACNWLGEPDVSANYEGTFK